MRSILKLMWANIRRGKGSFKGMIILMLLLTFSFSGTVSNNDRLVEARDEKFNSADVADLIVNIYGDRLTDDMLESVEEDPMVSEVKVREAVFFSAAVQLDGKENNMPLSLVADDGDTRVFIDDGKSFKENVSIEDGEIYLPYKLHIAKGFTVGTELALRTRSGFDEKFIIKGFYEDIYTGATTMGWNYCVVSPNDFNRILTEKTDPLESGSSCAIEIDWLHIKAADGVTAEELRKEFGSETTLISSSNNVMSREYLIDCIEMYSRVGTRTVGIFVVLLLVVILISMYNSLSASIELDYTELGILKAEGFTTRQISLVYILQYIIALILGGAAGILISIPACDLMIGAWKNITGILTDTSVSFAKCGILCVMIIAVCTLFILMATSRIRTISPVRAISGSVSDVHFDSRLKVPVRRRPLSFFIALRQLCSSKKSYIGTMLIVAMLVFFLVSIMILTHGLDTDELFYSIGGEIELTDIGGLDIDTAEQIDKDIKEIDGDASVEFCSNHNLLVDNEMIRVNAFRSNEPVFKPAEGRAPIYDNEIFITKNVSEMLGKEIGDTVTVKYLDNEEDYVVTGYFDTIFDFGISTYLTVEGLEKLGYTDISEAYIRLGNTSKQTELISILNDKYADKLEASVFTEDAYGEAYREVVDTLMLSLTLGMYAVLMIFAAVVVNMVCKRAFIRERRDIGIYKAMGFTADDLRLQFAVRFALVAVAGAALGCVISMLFSRRMLTFILRIVGLTDFTTDYALITYIGPAAAISLCFFVTAYFSSRKVKSVEVRELITE